MLRQLRESKKYLLVSLAEIDYFLESTKDTSVLFALARMTLIEPKKPYNVLGVLFTARSKDFPKAGSC